MNNTHTRCPGTCSSDGLRCGSEPRSRIDPGPPAARRWSSTPTCRGDRGLRISRPGSADTNHWIVTKAFIVRSHKRVHTLLKLGVIISRKCVLQINSEKVRNSIRGKYRWHFNPVICPQLLPLIRGLLCEITSKSNPNTIIQSRKA